ncbi:hypothetical protein LC612_35020 [Nostoc sp. CHAB 5834]|nr:hypothetical protein [Nostoc sp. CHAB 5834]
MCSRIIYENKVNLPYVIEENGTEKTYRLITDLMDISNFLALLLASEYPAILILKKIRENSVI